MTGALERHGVSEETLKKIDPKLHHADIKPLTILLEAGITPEELKNLHVDLRRLFLDNPHEVRILLNAIPFNELKALDHPFANFVIEHAHTTLTLLKSGLSWNDFKKMDPKKRRQILGAAE